MVDIVKAIEREKEYLEHRANGVEPFHLIDAVKECGFEGLKEYFEVKREYEFNTLEFAFVEQPMPGGVAEIFNMIQANKPGVLFVDWEDTYVVCANQGLEEFNKQYCEENDITFFPLRTGGGTIVGSTGDFSFGVCCPKTVVSDYVFILDHVRDILQRHTAYEVTVDGNDICVNGNKICGSASYTAGDVFMVIMHFSFYDWSELITNICAASKVGKPVTYVDFMTRTEFKQEVARWLRVKSI